MGGKPCVLRSPTCVSFWRRAVPGQNHRCFCQGPIFVERTSRSTPPTLLKNLPHTHTHTLRIGCPELKAVPHAGRGFQFLRVPVRTIGAWGSSNGEMAQRGRTRTADEQADENLELCNSSRFLAWPHAMQKVGKFAGTQLDVSNCITGD